ncbi:hypothetical protein ACU19_06765 [Actinobaculum suis]|nr:hypothetical protein ACU19_06765 [Actinobaculum suis]
MLVQSRPGEEAAFRELESVARFAGLPQSALFQIRLDAEVDAGNVDTDWEALLAGRAGVILGGSPFDAGAANKSALQIAVEKEIHALLEIVVEREIPFLGLCYGIGALGTFLGATVDTHYGEDAGPVTISLTPEATTDPVFAGLPENFTALVGHHEALREVPAGAVLLATGEGAPVQAFRYGPCAYATQFHPELDAEAIIYRLDLYADRGYMDLSRKDEIYREIRAAELTDSHRVLENFARVFGRQQSVQQGG